MPCDWLSYAPFPIPLLLNTMASLEEELGAMRKLVEVVLAAEEEREAMWLLLTMMGRLLGKVPRKVFA